jgi:hypothetical protein
MTESKTLRVRADFNGLFGQLLCLSHKDTCEDVDKSRDFANWNGSDRV